MIVLGQSSWTRSLFTLSGSLALFLDKYLGTYLPLEGENLCLFLIGLAFNLANWMMLSFIQPKKIIAHRNCRKKHRSRDLQLPPAQDPLGGAVGRIGKIDRTSLVPGKPFLSCHSISSTAN